MLFRNLSGEDKQSTLWEDMGHGAPTIIGYAELCRQAIVHPVSFDHLEKTEDSFIADELSDEAKTILVAAADRGTIDIRANRDSFNSAERFLAVCVEYQLDHRLLFLQKENPEQTVRFLDGFRQLCQSGLVIHHLQKDFSLSAAGFQVARSLKRSEYESLLEFATEIEH